MLDAQAVIAALTREPAATEVEALLRSADDPPCISAVNLGEVVDHLGRIRHVPVAVVRERLGWLVAAALEVVPVDEAIGGLAGELRAHHYHAKDRDVSMADCCALATAMLREEPLATADGSLAGMARDEGVQVIALVSTSGERPE